MADELCTKYLKIYLAILLDLVTLTLSCVWYAKFSVTYILSFHVSSGVRKLKWICEKQDKRTWNGEEQVSGF